MENRKNLKTGEEYQTCPVAEAMGVTELPGIICPYHDTDLFYGYVNLCTKEEGVCVNPDSIEVTHF